MLEQAPPHDSQASRFFDRQRRSHLAQRLQARVIDVCELSNGYAIELAPDRTTPRLITELVLLEWLTRPTLQVEVELLSSHGPTCVRLTGGPDDKAYLESDPVTSFVRGCIVRESVRRRIGRLRARIYGGSAS